MTAALIFFMGALLCPPARPRLRAMALLEGRPQAVEHMEPLARVRRSLAAQSRTRRELLYFGLALLVGLVVVPLLTWLVGSRILGPYSRGTEVHDSAFALLSDFFAGLA